MALYLITPEEELRETTANAIPLLGDVQNLPQYRQRGLHAPPPTFVPFVPPEFRHLVPMVAVRSSHDVRADWNDVLERGAFGRPKETFAVEELRRNLMFRKRGRADDHVVAAALGAAGAMGRSVSLGGLAGVGVGTSAAASPGINASPSPGLAGAGEPGSRSAAKATAAQLQEVKKMAKSIVDRLWKLDFSIKGDRGKFNPFIDVITRENHITLYRLPTYFDVVQEPMNLTWIKERVTKKHYSNMAQFAADVLLMVANALAFNPPGDRVHAAAESLRNVFYQELLLCNHGHLMPLPPPP